VNQTVLTLQGGEFPAPAFLHHGFAQHRQLVAHGSGVEASVTRGKQQTTTINANPIDHGLARFQRDVDVGAYLILGNRNVESGFAVS